MTPPAETMATPATELMRWPATRFIEASKKVGERLPWVDVARGICMLLVLLMHIDELHYAKFFEGTPAGPIWAILTGIAKPMRIPTFFAISGFLASGAIIKPWGQILEKRVVLLYYVYAVWTIISTISLTYLKSLDGPINYSTTLHTFARNLIWPGSLLWFLGALIVYFLVARALRSLPALPVLLIATVITGLTYQMHNTHVVRSFLYFAMGAYLPQLLPYISRHTNIKTFIGSGMFLAMTSLFVLYVGKDKIGVWVPANFAGLWFCIAFSTMLARTSLSVPLAAIGRNTLPIFVMHPIVIAFLSFLMGHPLHGVTHTIQQSVALSALYPIFANLTVLGCCLGCHELFTKAGMPWLFTLPDILRSGQRHRNRR